MDKKNRYLKGDWGYARYAVGVEPPIDYENRETLAIFSESAGDVCYFNAVSMDEKEQKELMKLLSCAPTMLNILRRNYDLFKEMEEEYGMHFSHSAIIKSVLNYIDNDLDGALESLTDFTNSIDTKH